VAPEARAMIASRAGLAVLAAIAIVLAALVAFEPHRAPQDRALAPGLDVAQLRELQWDHVKLVRDDHGWAWVAPPGRAEPATIDAVLAALRGARWHRRAPREAAGKLGAILAAGGRTFEIGGHLEGADQTWIAREGDAVLVDDWVVRALAPDPLALRVRHPFTHAPPAPTATYRVDPRYYRTRDEAYQAIEILALPPCPDGDVLIHPPSGDGCVDAKQWRDVDPPGPPPPDLRPVPFAPQRIEFADHSVLDLAKRPQLDGHDADPDRTAELVAVLTEATHPVQTPVTKPTSTITVSSPKDSVTLDLDEHTHTLSRHGEPSGLLLKPDAWSVLARPTSALRDTSRWLEDAATISAITIDGNTFRRGATLGAWTDARDPALVEALATALAALRAPTGPAPANIDHTIELAITPPAGAPTKHRLELGAHCAALADGQPVALPLAACTAAVALTSSSSRR
jgi:hypothetical protein